MGKNGENLEVEVKFHVPDLIAIRTKLVAINATLTAPRVYERNVLFDNAWQGLRRKGQILRLRQDKRARLTFKGMPEQPQTSEAKVREELEVEVSDFAALATILERIGFTAGQIYEKYRESFEYDAVEIVLDELPFGNFVELEGNEPAIRALAARLDLVWSDRVLAPYIALMAQLKNHHQLSFDDLTFANFEDQKFSVADILR